MRTFTNIPSSSGSGLWFLLKGFRVKFFSALLFQAGEVAAGTAGYFVLRFYVDDIINTGDWRFPLIYFSLFYIGFALFRGVFSFLTARGVGGTAEGIARDLRNSIFDHIQKLSFSYHDKTRTGELIQKSTSDVDTIRRFYNEMISGLSRILFMFIINLVSIFYLNTKLALLSIIVIPLLVAMSVFFFNRIHNSYESYQDQDGKVSSAVQENLTGVRVVRAFARQNFEMEKFDEENREKFKRGKRFLINHAMYWPSSHIVCAAQQVFGIIMAAFMVIDGTLSIGDMVAYIGFLNTIIWPIQQMGRIVAQLSTASVSYGRVASILLNDQEELTLGKADAPLKGHIEYRNLSFSYDNSGKVLKNIDIVCEPGHSVALLGETGSGKTSLVNLLPGFYKKDSGELLIDGHPIEEYSRHFLRRNIGIVEQEPFLFSTTIRENISYGVDRDVSEEEIHEAAKAAAIHKSILSFPEKYDTIVGEKGVTLSGGQKQRIAIARTILKNPRILILDDSTSAVDAETEDNIRDALNSLMKGRTTFIIAHRVQSLIDADQILVFKEGRIIQRGVHQSLIDVPGFYKHVFELQNKIEAELEAELEQEVISG
ncbi:ABC transporter ATP-binding protein [Spirochaeta isovalerica]|uniref:ATP-binding cassette subfamily B protein n=1 Tax=Spirochaeta isovalerica TaxID=150 RepID=A0A841R999_9SPIO|nr:ABC transporter ATP-binding protein [Spirochaeta isovalerica]MBB6479519.1 ATP-binding cassette subfamily B protein [Spirochaeta isovalerica]